MSEWIDAFGADADAVAEAKHFWSAASSGTVRFSDDCVIALAIRAALPRDFLEAIDADQALDEDFDELDEKSELLHGNDQSVVFFTEMAFHELRRLPLHQLAFR
jgi:hypothetical protein